ncbi:hypothetical protein CCUS01_06910 [Colletotrichum cuscutae]|uniref:Uncharacterized protein n=1 Tax=Colletotrichum cuscutae TaxID=1209917 RepID=A0AAI9Y0P1_9PEZI|nr:hypothetical protein CCUS01_06910 [Colletotrichum cuscutae]
MSTTPRTVSGRERPRKEGWYAHMAAWQRGFASVAPGLAQAWMMAPAVNMEVARILVRILCYAREDPPLESGCADSGPTTLRSSSGELALAQAISKGRAPDMS